MNVRAMLRVFLDALAVAGFSFAGWLVVLGALSVLKGFPRPAFVAVHYALDAAIFGFLFWLYFDRIGKFAPFTTMAIAMGAIIVFELVLWTTNPEAAARYLNFTDWIVPFFLIMSAVYLAGVLTR
jgi:hypothetical protein